MEDSAIGVNLVSARAADGSTSTQDQLAVLRIDCSLVDSMPAAPPAEPRTRPQRTKRVKIDLAILFGPLPSRWWYRELFFHLNFGVAGIDTVDVTGSAQLTEEPASDKLPVWVSSINRNGVGCFVGPLKRVTGGSWRCTSQVVVEIPDDVAELSILARAEASIAARPTAFRCEHIRAERPTKFTIGMPNGRPNKPSAATPRVQVPQSTVRLCLAADIEGFSRFHNPEAARAQQRFLDVLVRARRHADLDEAQVELQQAGDGQFAVLPPALDESIVIPKLVDGLALYLAESNVDLNDHARLRLRVALHRGHVSWGVNGWIGDSTIAVHRLLDCSAIRSALRANPAADFALIVPDTLYRDVIAHHFGGLNPRTFDKVTARLPGKQFVEQAWIHLPTRG